MTAKRELSTASFWGILAVVAIVVLAGVYLLANPTTGEKAPSGRPPASTQKSSSASPPPPPPGGFPSHSD